MWDSSIGYGFFVEEYNRLARIASHQYGEEALELLPLIQLKGKAANPYDMPGPYWRGYLQRATNRLAALVAFLQSKASPADVEIDGLIDLIGMNLRSAIFGSPPEGVALPQRKGGAFR